MYFHHCVYFLGGVDSWNHLMLDQINHQPLVPENAMAPDFLLEHTMNHESTLGATSRRGLDG